MRSARTSSGSLKGRATSQQAVHSLAQQKVEKHHILFLVKGPRHDLYQFHGSIHLPGLRGGRCDRRGSDVWRGRRRATEAHQLVI